LKVMEMSELSGKCLFMRTKPSASCWRLIMWFPPS
jgi:hypothetical protein